MFDEYRNAGIKDDILKSLTKTKSTHDLSSDLSQNIHLVSYLVEELSDARLVTLRNVTSKFSHTVSAEYFVTITNKGTYFLNFNGGHKRLARKMMLKTAWTIAKIMAVISNAFIIIYLSYLSLQNQLGTACP